MAEAAIEQSQSDEQVLKAVRAFRDEAERARRSRIRKGRQNVSAYLGLQDWSAKTKGQSREFLPKTPTAVEMFSAFVKRALTQIGSDWFSVALGRGGDSPLTPQQIRDWLLTHLSSIPIGNGQKSTSFPLILSDAVKVGLLESLVILKVHGRMFDERTFVAERGEPVFTENGVEEPEPELKSVPYSRWRLQVDVIRPEDYYPDPTGRGLYEIHEVERDFHEVLEAAEAGMYDPEVVKEIEQDFERERQDKRYEFLRGQDETNPPDARKRVKICEFWGTILDEKGRVLHKNVVTAIANDKYVIREPEPNPFWHQESPFVVSPLVRVPFSVWHKAIFDHASPLNKALNELFNLMVDGSLASVWGVKQLRINDLDDPRQVSGGIPQGETLIVKSTLPHGSKVIEQCTEGEVPTDAMAMFEAINREFLQASYTNEVRAGSLPAGDVKATAIVEASQSQAVTLDSIASDIEIEVIQNFLRKAFLTILQNADDLDSDEVISAVGLKGAVRLSRMAPAERYAALAKKAQFKVSGLSTTLARVRDFQKTMALLQAVGTNPLLFQAFMRRFSADKTLNTIMKQLNINPEGLEKDEAEVMHLGKDLEELQQIMQFIGNKGGNENGGGAGMAAEDVGEPGLPAEINQEQNPMTGMV